MKILKRKLLLSLSIPIDFFKTGEGYQYKPYKFLYFLLQSFRLGSVRDAIGQLIKSGEADKIVRNNVPFFRLTGAGRERLLSFFPIFTGQSRVWDKKWRIVIGAPRSLRLKLKDVGLKKLSSGVFITPLPVSDKIKNCLLEENLLGKVTVIESRKILSGDDKNLAKEIWKLERSVKEYLDFIKQCRSLLRKINVEKRLIRQDRKMVVDLFNSYFSLLSNDPGLPKKVLPDDWPGDFARNFFLNIFERLENEKLLDAI